MKTRKTSVALAALMTAGVLAQPLQVIAAGTENALPAIHSAKETGGRLKPEYLPQPVALTRAAKEKTYDVTYRLVKDGDVSKPSMAAGAVKEGGEVVEKDGRYTYRLHLQPMTFAGQKTEASQVYYYENGEKKAATAGEDGAWTFTLGEKIDQVKVAFKVDIMDGFEPEALLLVTWPKEAPKEETPSPEPEKKDPVEEKQDPTDEKKDPADPNKDPKDESDKPKTDDGKKEDGTMTEGDKKPDAKPEESKEQKNLKATLEALKSTDTAQFQPSVRYDLKSAESYGESLLNNKDSKPVDMDLLNAFINYGLVVGEKTKIYTVEAMIVGKPYDFEWSAESEVFTDISQYIENIRAVKKYPGVDSLNLLITLKARDNLGKLTYIEKVGEDHGQFKIIEKVKVGEKVYPKVFQLNNINKFNAIIDDVEGPVSIKPDTKTLRPQGAPLPIKYWREIDLLNRTLELLVQRNDVLKDSEKTKLIRSLRKINDSLKAQGNALNDFDYQSDRLFYMLYSLSEVSPYSKNFLQKAIHDAKYRNLDYFTDTSKQELIKLIASAEKALADPNLSQRDADKYINGFYQWRGIYKTQPTDSFKKPDAKKPAVKKRPDVKKDSAAEIIHYSVPVRLVKSDGSQSMASGALYEKATVDFDGKNYTYNLRFKPISMKGLKGNVTNLFYYDGTSRHQASYYGDGEWSFDLSEKANRTKVAIWVDAMDALAGGEGKGEQTAYLDFDWDHGVETGRTKGNVAKKDADKKKDAAKKEAKKLETQKKREGEREKALATFIDVGRDHWALDAVAHSLARGYMQGVGGGKFEPNRAITRGEFVTLLGRKAQAQSSQKAKFNDVNDNAYYAPYIAWASEKNIVQGVGGGKFEPNRAITREEMAVILDRFMTLEGQKDAIIPAVAYSDRETIAPWAMASVERMTTRGLVRGLDGGIFAPKTAFSRAQAAQILLNLDLLNK